MQFGARHAFFTRPSSFALVSAPRSKTAIAIHNFAHSRCRFESTRCLKNIWREPAGFVCCRVDPTKADCFEEQIHKRTLKLRELGAEDAFPMFDASRWRTHLPIMEAWYARGPPPLSDYTLSFGKHMGKRIDEVPDTYLVKFLIPRVGPQGLLQNNCPMVNEVVADFMRSNPGVKSQAGRVKTIMHDNDVKELPQKPRGRPRKNTGDDEKVQLGANKRERPQNTRSSKTPELPEGGVDELADKIIGRSRIKNAFPNDAIDR
jgi:hypothetical protein